MQSLKSRIFNYMLRNRHLFQGKFRKETFDFNTSIEKFRAQCEKSADRHAKIMAGVEIREETIQGIHAEWLIPEGADPQKMVLYVHGGGYVSGSCNDHRGFVSKFARFCGFSNLVYDYRLAPEHPFPAALEDSVTVYKGLLDKRFNATDIIIAGESAGGGLTLALLLALKERHISLPAAAVAISPWTDLTCSSDSYSSKNRVSVAPLNSWMVFSTYYAGNHPARSPFISPLFGNLESLPPILINSGVDDELYEDGEQFYKKAKAAGVDVTFRAGTGMVHCYPLLAPMFREATAAMDEICAFIHKHL
ncbi:alpha/beta hydrolase fold domain-containing protein [candidate division KSB1 bacterium]|nr:alpha/beta hydrolase fold domain-containing protein [candidate division KSB1 bacterium]